MARRWLFLQGVASPFFPRLADSLGAGGDAIFRINFCGGDALYWGRRPAFAFRERVEQLPGFLETLFERHGFTDLVLFGNRRPVHRPAIALARQTGIRLHVFEEGYIRPGWITLEHGGVNGDSRLPRKPEWYREVNRRLPNHGDGLPVSTSLAVRAGEDLAYHLANLANPVLFPGYRPHRPHGAALEYAGWVRRYAALPVLARFDAARIRRLLADGRPFFLLPLQLSADAQIIHYSPFRQMSEALEAVLRSFAATAPKDVGLVVKDHPLDTGLFDYRKFIGRLAAELDIGGRVLYLETGDLGPLFDRARGIVTVNSTTGLSALTRGRPVKVLGRAIYDLPGMTSQCSLDHFWQQPEVPDSALVAAFRNVVIHTTQVNGDFYTPAGIAMAVQGANRLLATPSPVDALWP